jgi:hypothetical protein
MLILPIPTGAEIFGSFLGELKKPKSLLEIN